MFLKLTIRRDFIMFANRPLVRTENQVSRVLELTAYDMVNSASEDALFAIFKKYSEDPLSRTIAKRICQERQKEEIKTTGQLAKICQDCYSGKYRKRSKKDPATKIFQALRIFLNDELEQLKKGLVYSERILKPDSRLVGE